MKKIPRYYQLDSFKSIIKSISKGGRPYVSMSTGSGKSIVCAMLAEKCLKQGVRALVLTPSSELVSQNYAEHFDYTDTKTALGICSAKLGKYQVTKQIVHATYTSFLKKRATSGAFNALIIDEAHYVSPLPNSSYQKIIRSLLRLNPDMKIIGLSATPYREKQGFLHFDCIDGLATFTECAYETNIPQLIKEGYLSHVESISGDIEADLSGVKLKSNGDFNDLEMSYQFDEIVKDAVADMRVKFTHYGIKTALIYASSLENARHIVTEWGDSSTIRLAYGDMPNSERNALVKWLKTDSDNLRAVVNVGLFVTGFDFRQLACVVFMLSTMSLAKYVQIAGRVIRAHDNKDIGYVLDFGGNIERHGPIDETNPPRTKKRRADAPKKPCTAIIETPVMYEDLHYRVGDVCGYPNPLSARRCRVCDAEFISEGSEGKYRMRSRAQLLSEKQAAKDKAAEMAFTYEVKSVFFEEAISKNSGIKMIKMSFYGEDSEFLANDYLCLNHTGIAKHISIAKVMSLLIDKKSFYQIGKHPGGVCVKSVLFLLGEEYFNQFFKQIKTVTIAREGCFDKVKSWNY